MANILLDLIKFNESINYSSLITLIVLYLAFFWAAVSIWVYLDARKRLNKTLWAIILAIMNFVFLIPFLILYLLLRPEEKESFEDFVDGGVNIPIVNFTGKDGGVAVSFELRINTKKFNVKDDSEMKIDISFDSNDPNKMLVSGNEQTLLVNKQGEVSQVQKITLRDKLANRLRGLRKIFFKEEAVIITTQPDLTDVQDLSEKKERRKKKKRK